MPFLDSLTSKLGDLDDVFAYQTPKVSKIRDRNLGLIRFALMGCIAVYILIGDIIFKGKHLKVGGVEGVFRLQLKQPTMGDCNEFDVHCAVNFTRMQDLSYCTQSSKPSKVKLPCSYWDAMQLGKPQNSGMLISSLVKEYRQHRACEPSKDNGWSCEGPLFTFDTHTKSGETAPNYETFVADLERFTLLFDHAFRSEIGVQHDDGSMLGYFEECENPADPSTCVAEQIPCDHNRCPAGSRKSGRVRLVAEAQPLFLHSGRRAGNSVREYPALVASSQEIESSLDDEAAAFTIPKGDVFTFGELLRMAKIDLDSSEGSKSSIRSQGLTLVVNIHYSNVKRWNGLRIFPWSEGPLPTYTYRVQALPGEGFKVRQVEGNPWESKRSIWEYKGVRVVIEQTGSIAVWDTSTLLMVGTTSLGLLAVANFGTDFLMLNLFKKKQAYSECKYDVSKDFNP